MTTLNIMEWNLNQRGRQYENRKRGDGEIPLWIVDEIPGDVNIIVFTEFNSHAKNIQDFYSSLEEKGFKHWTTNYSYSWSNDILIAILGEEIEFKSYEYIKSYPDNEYIKSYADKHNRTFDFDNIPENLRVDIKVKDKIIHLWGVRIKCLGENYKKRKEQMESLMSWIKDSGGINILVGDFNNLREETTVKYWNLKVLDELIERCSLKRKTPKNHSWGARTNKNGDIDGYIKNDHLICSEEIDAMVEQYYRWSFLDKVEYTICKKDKKTLKIPERNPDHGILIATCCIRNTNDIQSK